MLDLRFRLVMFRFRFRPSFVAFATSFFFNRSSSNETKSSENLKQPEFSRERYEHLHCTGFDCLRESSMLALTTSSSFLKQTLHYYSELTHRYCVHISSMIKILEEFQRHEGFAQVQEQLWTLHVDERGKMETMKKELLRLRLLLSTIDRLVHESIDAAYQTLDETLTQLVASELSQAKLVIEQNERLISDSDRTLIEENIKLIDEAKVPQQK